MATYEIVVMKAKHKLMVDLHLNGLSNIAIADELDCTPVSVSMILKAPIVQAEIARRRENLESKVDDAYAEQIAEARRILSEATPIAAEVLVGQMGHNDPRVAQSAAKHILESTFGSTNDKTRQVAIQINVEQMNLLQQTLVEVA